MNCPSMTKNLSRKLSEVFALIIPQVIRMHFSEWEVCYPRTPRGMRILVLIIPPGNPNIFRRVGSSGSPIVEL